MSIIAESTFLAHLYEIQNQNPPSFVLFPDIKQTYDIDLSSRVTEAPLILSVSKDHQSETIYFKVDRFRDYMDLSNTVCVIQYTTPDNKTHLYVVPFYDIMTYRLENKMIIPWCVDGNVTKYAGTIHFSIRFFVAKQEVVEVTEYNEEGEPTTSTEIQYKLVYNLTTLPAQTKVLEGMEVSELASDFDLSAEQYEYLLSLINSVKREGVYWTIL